MTTTGLSRVDLEALERAYKTAAAESAEYSAHLAAIARQRDWQTAAEQAAFRLQCRNLKLKVWECPPSCVHGDEIGMTYGTKAKEVKLKRRLLGLGLSVYEPDPQRAIERVESARRAARVAVDEKKSALPVA
jgi:hypothetical protein